MYCLRQDESVSLASPLVQFINYYRRCSDLVHGAKVLLGLFIHVWR
ncbi:hypothetical protein [Pasteuria penetrans]|nr:hypothetical protein [Pasteuria penetrans]